MKETLAQLKNSRQGGIMALLRSGKVAFPLRGETIPLDACAGEYYHIDVVRESEKYAFFRFIESDTARRDRELRAHCDRVKPVLAQAMAEFPDESRFKAAYEGCVAGVWRGTEGWVDSLCKELRQTEELRRAAKEILSQLRRWQEPEPPVPEFQNPAFTTVIGKVTAHTQWETCWEGDGMRGRNDDGIRSATVHGYIISVSPADVLAATSDWPVCPQVEKLEVTCGGIGYDQEPIGATLKVSVNLLVRSEDYRAASDLWHAVNSVHCEWERKRDIVHLARCIDGVVQVPVGDIDGNIKAVPINPHDVFAVEGELSDWKSYESWLNGSAGD